MRAVNIKWDTDGDQDAFDSLPQEIQVPKGMAYEDIEDYLSDQTGFCHLGFDVYPDKDILEIEAKDLQANLPCDLTWSAYRLRSMDDAVDVADAVYGGHNDGQLDLLEGASFPCWALFWQNENYEGRCEGTLESFQEQTADAIRIIAAEAGKYA